MTFFRLCCIMYMLSVCSGNSRMKTTSFKPKKNLVITQNSVHYQSNILIRGGSTHVLPIEKFQTVLVALISPSVSGGLLSGGLHAITGAHHNQSFHCVNKPHLFRPGSSRSFNSIQHRQACVKRNPHRRRLGPGPRAVGNDSWAMCLHHERAARRPV
jgi:hypothetical protein